ncbi:MAG: InlB B-repeat-containing protein [Clostridium sp.]|nr:InlB B-repeat-containing protein [Clostridium sp.]
MKYKKHYKKTVAAVLGVATICLNSGIVTYAENATISDSINNATVADTLYNTPKIQGDLIYVDQIHSGVEDGSEANPYKSFQTAYDKAKDGDTIIIKGSVTILGQGNTGADPFVCKKNITIQGMDGTDPVLNSRSSFQLGANVTLKNFKWAFPAIAASDRGIFLNGHELKMENIPVETASVTGKPTVYGGSYQSNEENAGAHSNLIVDNTTGQYTVFENIYAGNDNTSQYSLSSATLNSGVKVEDTIYANGESGEITGDIQLNIGTIIANKFEKKSTQGMASLLFNGFNGGMGINILGFTNVTINNSNIVIKDETGLDKIGQDLQLLGNSIFDISAKTSPLQVGRNFVGEGSSKIILAQNGLLDITDKFNGSIELRTPGVDTQSSGPVLENHVYLSAADTSTGQVIFKPFWKQTMYDLKQEDNGDKKQWIIRLTDKPKLDALEITGSNRVEITDQAVEEYQLSFKDKDGNPLGYVPVLDNKILDPNGQEVSEDDIYLYVDEAENKLTFEILNNQISAGNYTIVLTDALTGKEFTHILELYNTSTKHNVLFDFNGGHDVNDMNTHQIQVSVSDNAHLTRIADPVKEGYTFSGWYTDTNFNTAWNFENMVVSAPMTLYAKWEANEYKVVFDANDGTGTMAEQGFVYDTAQELTANAFSKEGHTFKGWSTMANGQVVYADRASVNNLTSANNGTVTLYAVWETNQYTVTFKNWDGSVLKTEQVAYNTAAIAPTEPTRDGYRFTGWDKTFDAITGNTEITAQYVKTWTVTFKDDDGTVLKTETVDEGTAATAPTNPTRDGYRFTGWDKTFDTVTGNTEITAQYVKTWTVTFKDDDGTVLKTEIVDEGTGATAPTEPIKDGHTFAGWDVMFDNVTGDTVVTATYEIDQYTVIFKDWNGTELKTEQVVYNTAATAPVAPTRDGYRFTGWDKTFDTITGNTEITAQYVKTWTVTFRDEDGSVLKTENVDEGTGATAPTAPIKDGYRFTGWDVTFNNITDDTVVTAQYEKEETAVPPAEPEQPQTPEQGGEMNNTVTEEKTQTGTDLKTVKTGDNSIVEPLLATGGISSVAAAIAFFFRKKKKSE